MDRAMEASLRKYSARISHIKIPQKILHLFSVDATFAREVYLNWYKVFYLAKLFGHFGYNI